MVTGERQWIVGCEMHRAQLSGAWRAGQRGDMVRGQAILIRRAGDVLPARETERLSAYVLHPSFSLGLERYGAFSFGWFSDASGPKQSSTVRIEEVEGGLRFDLNPEIPVKGRILLQREPLVLYPWDHLLAFEAQVVRKVWGTPVRSLSHATARVEIEGAEVESRAMIVRVRWQDILPPRPEKVLPAPAGLPADPRATNPTERFRPPGSVAPSKP
jgi:hypothetical protein